MDKLRFSRLLAAGAFLLAAGAASAGDSGFLPGCGATISLECAKPDGWTFESATNRLDDGRTVYTVSMSRDGEAVPPKFSVRVSFPQRRVRHLWSPNGSRFPMSLYGVGRRVSSLCENMPLYSYIDDSNGNRLTIGASECARSVAFRGGVREEGCNVFADFDFFTQPEAPISSYRLSLCFDESERAFWDAVPDMVRWMEREAGYEPCVAPPAAFKPLYSTWYGFHQNVHAADIEAECAMASAMGMETIILDDGWQTEDGSRGYRFCGDWRPAPSKFPDMAAHVAKVRAAGMKYMVWYSVPFIGHESENAERFKGKYLYDHARLGAYVLDPRFPEVREFLAETYARAAREWGLDGFKLDFIDSFKISGTDPAIAENYAGRDIKSVPLAVDELLKDVRKAILSVRPDALVEFRQSYVGPGIRRYGNMLRVADCPGDMRQNRMAIANLRLVSGKSSVHADMLEWNLGADAEDAALNIVSSIFGTVQYSQVLRDAPESHLKSIRHWVAFAREHEDALQHGWFRPHHPELSYPLIESGSGDERIVATYAADMVAEVAVEPGAKTIFLNGTDSPSAMVSLAAPAKAVFRNTFGEIVGEGPLPAGISRIPVPSAGYAEIVGTGR